MPGKVTMVAVRKEEFMGIHVDGLADAMTNAAILSSCIVQLYEKYFLLPATEEEWKSTVLDRRYWSSLQPPYRDDIIWLVERFDGNAAADQFEDF